MMLGEYAVLYGKKALVTAVDKRMTVSFIPRADQTLHLHSNWLGQYTTTLGAIKIAAPFQYVLASLIQHEIKLKNGYDIYIESEFSDQIGLGSSAAVTVATLSALTKSLNIHYTPIDLLKQGLQVIRAVQGVGSGADLAASIYGGLLVYQRQPIAVEKIAATYPITLLYAGYKTKTAIAIQQVEQRFKPYAQLFNYLCHSIGQCTQEGIEHIRKKEWEKLGQIMKIQQGMMNALGVNQPQLQSLIDTLENEPHILGAKISGAGLGDCVLGLGHTNKSALQQIPVAMTLEGVRCEKI